MTKLSREKIYSFLSQVIRYGLVGASNTLLDTGLYTIFTRTSDFLRTYFLIANALSFVLVTLWSFEWNRRWTFRARDGDPGVQYIKFFIISLVGLLISEGVLYFAIKALGLHDLIGKVRTIPAVFMWNFFMHLFWTFRAKPQPLTK